MKKFTLLFLLLIGTTTSYSQHVQHCATDEFTAELINNDPEYAQKLNQLEAYYQSLDLADIKQKSQGIVYTIPVVFHVIYNDYRDNISRLQIEDGLRILNEDFRRMNADASNLRSIFTSVAADVEIQFELAKIDPNGNCTEGITRTQSPLSINARDNVKSLVSWDNSKYLNIWLVNSIIPSSTSTGTVLGYAYLPVFGSQPASQDGMVLRHDQVGMIGTALNSPISNAANSRGRTITHEAGHYLGLRHTFQNGCNGSGDGVSDTPPVLEANDGCDPTTNTCSTDNPDMPDMIENYMDYTNGSCQNTFTAEQALRMRATLQNSNLRLNLRSTTNLANTGITNPPNCTQPEAIAEQDKSLICAGESINFFDASEDGDPTSWNWTFPGGNPSSSNQQNPSIVYTTPGVYDVHLSINTGAGTDSVVYSRAVSVKAPGSSTYYPNWSDDFENISSPSDDITIIDNGDAVSFQLFTQAGSSGTQSLKLDNFNVDFDEEIDEVVSPAISTIFTKNLDLSFDYAFASKTSTDDDELRIYASTDCGETWTLRRFYRGGQLETAPINTQAFTPSGASEWSTKSIGFDAYIGPNPLLVKFEFISGGGNNFYLDNIRFTGTIGLEEYYSNSISLFPNPASQSFTLSSSNDFELSGASLRFLDITGKEILKLKNNENGNLDEWNINLESQNLAPGVYVLAIENDHQQKAFKKLIIE